MFYIGSRFYTRIGLIAPKDMDFVSNIAEIEADIEDDPPPSNAWERVWAWMM
jgi:amino acid transporter